MFFFYKKIKTTTKPKSKHKKSLLEPGIEPGTSRPPVWSVTSWPPRQLYVSIEVKLFKWFNVKCHNLNQQCQICRPHFFNIVVFSVIF